MRRCRREIDAAVRREAHEADGQRLAQRRKVSGVGGQLGLETLRPQLELLGGGDQGRPVGCRAQRLCGLPQVVGRAPRAPRLDDECDDQHDHRHDEHELEPHGLSIACQPT